MSDEVAPILIHPQNRCRNRKPSPHGTAQEWGDREGVDSCWDSGRQVLRDNERAGAPGRTPEMTLPDLWCEEYSMA